MRLISQDRKVDIPYENSAVYIVANYGYSKENGFHNIVGYEIMAHTGDDYWNLGDYSTEEKALQVMEMLQQAYLGNEALILEMPEENTEEITEKMKNIMSKQGYGTLRVISEERKPRVDYYPLHTYFKFPTDEAVNDVSA